MKKVSCSSVYRNFVYCYLVDSALIRIWFLAKIILTLICGMGQTQRNTMISCICPSGSGMSPLRLSYSQPVGSAWKSKDAVLTPLPLLTQWPCVEIPLLPQFVGRASVYEVSPPPSMLMLLSAFCTSPHRHWRRKVSFAPLFTWNLFLPLKS